MGGLFGHSESSKPKPAVFTGNKPPPPAPSNVPFQHMSPFQLAHFTGRDSGEGAETIDDGFNNQEWPPKDESWKAT